jgi:hypothetical protein
MAEEDVKSWEKPDPPQPPEGDGDGNPIARCP